MVEAISSSYYDRDYYEGGVGKGAYSGQELCDDGAEAGAANWLIERFNLTQNKKVLDLGCSKGFRVYLLTRRNIESYGIDCSEYAAKYWLSYLDGTRKGSDYICPDAEIMDKRLVCGDVTNLPYPSSEFDLVTGYDLLEHLTPEQVDKCVTEAIRVTKNHIFFHFYIGEDRDVGKPENESDQSHISVYSMEWWKNRILNLTDLSIQMGRMGTVGWIWIWKDLDIPIGGGNFFQRIKE